MKYIVSVGVVVGVVLLPFAVHCRAGLKLTWGERKTSASTRVKADLSRDSYRDAASTHR